MKHRKVSTGQNKRIPRRTKVTPKAEKAKDVLERVLKKMEKK